MTKLGPAHLGAYCACAAAFVELLLAHYSDREVNVLLKNLNRHIAAAGTYTRAKPSCFVLRSTALHVVCGDANV